MIEYQFAAESFTIWKAILWCFYPVVALVGIELFLRAAAEDDDDDADDCGCWLVTVVMVRSDGDDW